MTGRILSRSERNLIGAVLVLMWIGTSASAAGGQAAAAAPAFRRPLAYVGPDTIRVADLDAEIAATLAATQGSGKLPDLDPDGVLKRLVQDRLLEQEGYRMGADQYTSVRNQLHEFIRLQCINALLDSVSAPPPGSAPVSADSLLGKTSTARRYSHILVPDEATARALRDSLERGIPFADLARRHSHDETAAGGGDLGWSAQGAYVDEFETAARKLRLHEISPPVHTEFGWHLITLTATRSDTLKSPEMARVMAASLERGRRNDVVRHYVDALEKRYGVEVDRALLSRLDYGSADPEVQKTLQNSDSALAVLPDRKLTVRGLTWQIRFKYFHGTAGRGDADAIRDQMFDQWLTETIVGYEARALGFDKRPVLVDRAGREERRLIREEVLASILNYDFKPSAGEISSYYRGHLTDFTPPPRLKLRSALLADEPAARAFRKQLDGGAAFRWLAEHTPGALDSPPPYSADWVDPHEVALGDGPFAEGTALGPFRLPGGWAVAQISAVEPVQPDPLDQCRDRVVQAMHGERNREVLGDALSRLRKATGVTLADGARSVVSERIEHWRASMDQGGHS